LNVHSPLFSIAYTCIIFPTSSLTLYSPQFGNN
jgi:hypothetical protein